MKKKALTFKINYVFNEGQMKNVANKILKNSCPITHTQCCLFTIFSIGFLYI